jgi:hypothetical protein
MKDIGILETITLENARKCSYSYLLIEKILIEGKYDWLRCVIVGNELLGQGYLFSKSSGKKYKILIKYSYHHSSRYDRVWVMEPSIRYNSNTHMYYDNTLCLYYPKDLPVTRITPLVTMFPWISEWLVKYEFWEKYKVWIGEEAPH